MLIILLLERCRLFRMDSKGVPIVDSLGKNVDNRGEKKTSCDG